MVNQETPNEAIIRKIQKLLALGDRGGTEAEAAAAMEMAQELLAKYNLDMAVVQDTKVEGGTQSAPEKREQTKVNKSAMYKWQVDLMAAIAETNFCFAWRSEIREAYTKRDKTHGDYTAYRKVMRHVILGKEVNVVAVRIMYEYLAETIESLLPYPNAERLSKSAINWREGCAHRLIERIRQRCYDMMKRSEAQATSSTGLVLRSLFEREYEANYDSMMGEGAYTRDLQHYKERRDNETPQEKAKRERQQNSQQRQKQREWASKDQDAYYAGRSAGNNISLNDRLGG